MSIPLPFPDDPAQEIRVPPEGLRQFLIQLLVKNSLFQADAQVAADRLLEADLRGLSAYGCARILDILAAINRGDVDPRGRVLTLKQTPALTLLDGSRAVGAVAGTQGMQRAIALAREVGVGTVAVGNSQPLGAAGVYALLAAREGMIGCCITSTGKASLAPPHATVAAVGNSAVAWAIPAGDAVPPLVFDFACGPASWGKLAWLTMYGRPLPADLLLDAEGKSTADPVQAAAIRSDPLGRGFGMSLVASVLAGGLSGGKMPLHKKRGGTADDSQHFFQAIDIAQFTDPQRFAAELESTCAELRELPLEGAAQNVRLPGDRGSMLIERNRDRGIPVHRSIAERLAELGKRFQLDVPW